MTDLRGQAVLEDTPARVRQIRRKSSRSPAGRVQTKRDNLDDEYTILTIGQTRQVLSTLIYAWFPEGERPSLPVTGAWDSTKLLGAVSDSSETFFLFLPRVENFNSNTTIRLINALQTEFGEKICVILDNASYFTANAVQKFVEETPIELCYLPRGSPELSTPPKSAGDNSIKNLATVCSIHSTNFVMLRSLHSTGLTFQMSLLTYRNEYTDIHILACDTTPSVRITRIFIIYTLFE